MADQPTQQEIGHHLAQDLSRMLNNYDEEARRTAVVEMLEDHRSLQQATMRFFMTFVTGMAGNGHDLRNEASVNLAKAIMALPEKVRALPRV